MRVTLNDAGEEVGSAKLRCVATGLLGCWAAGLQQDHELKLVHHDNEAPSS